MMPTNSLTSPSLSAAFQSTLKRDLVLAFRNRRELLNPLMFFTMAVSLFPIGITPDPDFLAKIASGVVWCCALLASLLSLDHMFKQDYEDGSLEQLLITPHPLSLLVLTKIVTHWLVSGLPLVVLAPLLGMMMSLPDQAYKVLILSLLIGTPVLSLLGGVGAALTVGLKKGGLLLPLLVIPLCVPVLIFGTGAVQAAIDGSSYSAQLALMGAFLMFSLAMLPMVAAASLRISVS